MDPQPNLPLEDRLIQNRPLLHPNPTEFLGRVEDRLAQVEVLDFRVFEQAKPLEPGSEEGNHPLDHRLGHRHRLLEPGTVEDEVSSMGDLVEAGVTLPMDSVEATGPLASAKSEETSRDKGRPAEIQSVTSPDRISTATEIESIPELTLDEIGPLPELDIFKMRDVLEVGARERGVIENAPADVDLPPKGRAGSIYGVEHLHVVDIEFAFELGARQQDLVDNRKLLQSQADSAPIFGPQLDPAKIEDPILGGPVAGLL